MAIVLPSGRHSEAVEDRAESVVRRPRRTLRVAMILFFAGSMALLGGFLGFIATLARHEPGALPRGDAIVALTGGADRIADAVGWLDQGHGKRLLISGVGPQVSVEALAQKSPGLRSWLSCCVDIGHSALNTVGNAEEARAWATPRGYRSLLVVTSNYHMPRAMLELRRHMPDMRLIPAPVVTDRLLGKSWADRSLWSDAALLKTLGQEYGKFLVAYVRARLTSAASPDHITANTNRPRAS